MIAVRIVSCSLANYYYCKSYSKYTHNKYKKYKKREKNQLTDRLKIKAITSSLKNSSEDKQHTQSRTITWTSRVSVRHALFSCSYINTVSFVSALSR